MTKLNCRAVPSASGSVYLDVSSRVMNGWLASFTRRSHFTLAFPSQPVPHEPVRSGIDDRDAAVMTLVVQIGGGDGAVEVLQRRSGTCRRRRSPGIFRR